MSTLTTVTTASCLLFRGIPCLYTYLLPEGEFQLGDHVRLPVGHSTCTGVIMQIQESEPDEGFLAKLKPILAKEDTIPPLLEETLALIDWFGKTYHCTPYMAYQTIVGKRKFRDLPAFTPPEEIQTPHSLNDEQAAALSQILAKKEHGEFMLHGVTSSGKTEIYLHLAKAMLDQGKSCIILIPEIALTPQFSTAFRQRFDQEIAILHSGLTPKQREVEWNKIYQEKTQIVIGPRSAIFAPFRKIGAIIIDEEHEPSYKQENNPRYYTHSVARFRAQYHDAALVYGSATPSVDTYSRPNIKHLTLKKRVLNRPMPNVTIVDQREADNLAETYLISTPLKEAITETLAAGNKAMILINRRGFSPTIICKKCQQVHACPSCGLSYTYHKDKTLRCHRCQTTAPLTHTCVSCKKNTLTYAGIGIQKVELALKQFFEDKHIIRLDKDSASTPKKLHALLDDFKANGDILVGTQLIAKGHHVESVTLVGVIGIDTTLNLPDFRSPERCFQLITQVAGRAGRGEQPGQVYVQTFQPEHYAISCGANHDFTSFYTQECQFRQALDYPPYTDLVHIIMSSKWPQKAENTAKTIASFIHKHSPNLEILGPNPCPIEKRQDYFRWQIILKANASTMPDVHQLLDKLPTFDRSIRVMVDIDPRSLL